MTAPVVPTFHETFDRLAIRIAHMYALLENERRDKAAAEAAALEVEPATDCEADLELAAGLVIAGDEAGVLELPWQDYVEPGMAAVIP